MNITFMRPQCRFFVYGGGMTYIDTHPELVHKERLDANDVAVILGVKPQTVQRMSRRGDLPEPTQRQPFLAWEASAFWSAAAPRRDGGALAQGGTFLPDQTPVPLRYWRPGFEDVSHVALDSDFIRVEYLRAGEGIALIYPRTRSDSTVTRRMNADRCGASTLSTVVVVGSRAAGENGSAAVNPSGFEVRVYPPTVGFVDWGHSEESYLTNSAVVARVLGFSLPYWAPGFPNSVAAGYTRPELAMTPHERLCHRALVNAAANVHSPELAAAFTSVARWYALDGYRSASGLLDEARSFGHFRVEMEALAVDDDDDEGERPQWKELARLRTGADNQVAGAAHAVTAWVGNSGAAHLLPTEMSPVARSFENRLVIIDPDEATFGHLLLANLRSFDYYESLRGATYLRDPLSPDTIVARSVDGRGARALHIIPSRLAQFRALPGVLDDDAVIDLGSPSMPFIVTADGVAHPLPLVEWSGYSYGYENGSGPMALAAMLTQLLDPVDGGDEVVTIRAGWVSGTILEDKACPASFTVKQAREWFSRCAR